MGNKFLLNTNHHNLKYLFEQKNLNSIQAIWVELSSDFNFNTRHIKGKEN